MFKPLKKNMIVSLPPKVEQTKGGILLRKPVRKEGHGVVVAVGSAVTDFAIGQKVEIQLGEFKLIPAEIVKNDPDMDNDKEYAVVHQDAIIAVWE